MLIFKCNLCKKEWELEEAKSTGMYSGIRYTYKDSKESHNFGGIKSYCHICQSEIDKAEERAKEDARLQTIKGLQK